MARSKRKKRAPARRRKAASSRRGPAKKRAARRKPARRATAPRRAKARRAKPAPSKNKRAAAPKKKKRAAARRPRGTASPEISPPLDPRGVGPEAAGQSGDTEGLSRAERPTPRASRSCWRKDRLSKPGSSKGSRTRPTRTSGKCGRGRSRRTTFRRNTWTRTRRKPPPVRQTPEGNVSGTSPRSQIGALLERLDGPRLGRSGARRRTAPAGARGSSGWPARSRAGR